MSTLWGAKHFAHSFRKTKRKQQYQNTSCLSPACVCTNVVYQRKILQSCFYFAKRNIFPCLEFHKVFFTIYWWRTKSNVSYATQKFDTDFILLWDVCIHVRKQADSCLEYVLEGFNIRFTDFNFINLSLTKTWATFWLYRLSAYKPAPPISQR